MSDIVLGTKGLYRPTWDTIWDQWISDKQEFEPGVLDLVLEKTTKRGLAIDAGAHIGTSTLRMAKHFSRVLSFEPHQVNFKCLKNNAGALPNVELYNAALGAQIRKCGLRYWDGNGGEYTVTSVGSNITMITLDSLNLDSCDFIKVDTEGYELKVLEGAKGTITEYRPAVIIEVNDTCFRHNITRDAASEYLKGLGAKSIGECSYNRLFRFDA